MRGIDDVIIGISIAIVIVFGCILYGIHFGFGAQCSSEGFELNSVEWRQCVIEKANKYPVDLNER